MIHLYTPRSKHQTIRNESEQRALETFRRGITDVPCTRDLLLIECDLIADISSMCGYIRQEVKGHESRMDYGRPLTRI